MALFRTYLRSALMRLRLFEISAHAWHLHAERYCHSLSVLNVELAGSDSFPPPTSVSPWPRESAGTDLSAGLASPLVGTCDTHCNRYSHIAEKLLVCQTLSNPVLATM